jgi:flagellar motility protein MotE (MotC chaperone)
MPFAPLRHGTAAEHGLTSSKLALVMHELIPPAAAAILARVNAKNAALILSKMPEKPRTQILQALDADSRGGRFTS